MSTEYNHIKNPKMIATGFTNTTTPRTFATETISLNMSDISKEKEEYGAPPITLRGENKKYMEEKYVQAIAGVVANKLWLNEEDCISELMPIAKYIRKNV